MNPQPSSVPQALQRALEHHQAGRLPQAEELYRHVLSLEPGNADALHLLGEIAHQAGDNEQAVNLIQSALAIQPSNPVSLSNLGKVLTDLGRLDEAERSLRHALALAPQFAEAHNNLGNVLRSMGRPAEAEPCFRQTLALRPDHAQAHNNLGVTLQDLGRPEEAAQSYRQALALKPDDAYAHNNLGVVLQNLARLEEAEQSYRRALALKPDFAGAQSNLIFMLDLREGCSVREQQEERRRWYAQHGRQHAQAIRPHENIVDADRKLRIGYVSADFCRHSAYFVFAPMIRGHDRTAFEVICYSGVALEDDATARLRQAADGWRSTLGVSDEALAEQIRRDRIDILVDLSGHSGGNRLFVFARKPAPVQVTAWGHPTGTGLETMDYLLSDPVMVPPEERPLYAEQVIDLPCCVCFEPPDYLTGISPLPALGGKPVTFGCVNRVEKISGRVIGMWGQILAAVPEGRLLLKDRKLDDAGLRQGMLRSLGHVGIKADRVRLLGYSHHSEHLKIYHEVDLGLDSYPHGGGVSTLEALYMGVPVVTLQGATPASRVSAAILTALGMHDWIAAGDQQYVRIAIEAARDLPRLARTRQDLRQRAAASPLGDLPRYTGAVETVYRNLWQEWCARQL